MTVLRRPRPQTVPATVWIFVLLFVLVVCLALVPGGAPSENTTTTNEHGPLLRDPSTLHADHPNFLQSKRQQLRHALQGLTSVSQIPQRLQRLRDQHHIIGERLIDIKQGKETVEEILHVTQKDASSNNNNKNNPPSKDTTNNIKTNDLPPMTVDEVISYLSQWLHQLHASLVQAKHAHFEGIWQAYHDLTVKTLYVWDQEYLQRMPERREDDSVFLSVASYRDEMCPTTLETAFAKAAHPDRLFVGLVQQNCFHDCRTGVLPNGTTSPAPPDPDCQALFCATEIGKEFCSQIRVLHVNETESLGPYAARYFTSKLWNGESWFMQIDAHMTFANNWDQLSLDMLHDAPAAKPIISHYPPAHTIDLETRAGQPSSRLCGPAFATTDLESQIIRLEGGNVWDKRAQRYPPFAPFTAAGYFVSHSGMLREVPFDPFLPWIFMGEEIIMSSRLWTSGYDIFSPRQSVVGHWYVRKHKPKFWESVNRLFTPGVHNPLQMLVLDRIKYQLGYPEASVDVLPTRSILTAVESYSMGTQRPLKDYMKIVGLNMTTKEVTFTEWCEKGYPPPGMEEYNKYYPDGVAKKTMHIVLDSPPVKKPAKESSEEDDLGDDNTEDAEEDEATDDGGTDDAVSDEQ